MGNEAKNEPSIILGCRWHQYRSWDLNRASYMIFTHSFMHSFNVFARNPWWSSAVDSSWNVMAHGDVLEGKWRGKWRMQWVASTLHTTSQHGVSSITTADAAHLGCQQSTELTPPGRFKWTRPFRPKDEICFLCVCHHISNAVYRPVSKNVIGSVS